MAFLIRTTSHLTIRPLRLSDFTSWMETHSQINSAKNKFDRDPKKSTDLSLKEFKVILKNQRRLRTQDRSYDLAVFEKSSKRLVGAVGIRNVVRDISQSATLGYHVFNIFWGKGYGKAASLMAIRIGLEDLKLHRLEAGIEPANCKSLAVARAIGLRNEGLKRNAVFLRGKWRDLVTYSITSEDLGLKWSE